MAAHTPTTPRPPTSALARELYDLDQQAAGIIAAAAAAFAAGSIRACCELLDCATATKAQTIAVRRRLRIRRYAMPMASVRDGGVA